MAAHTRRGRGHYHFSDYLAGLERIFALRIDSRKREKSFELYRAPAGRANDRRARAHRDQRRRKIRRMHDVRWTATQNRVVTIEAGDRVALVAALLQAIHVGIAKIPASRALQELPADRAKIANLRRRRLAGGFGNSGEAGADRGMLGDFAQLRGRTEAKFSRRPHLDSTEFLQAFEIHQRGWRYDALLRQIDDIDAARKCDVAVLGKQLCGACELGRRDHLESVHRNSKSFTRVPEPPARDRA